MKYIDTNAGKSKAAIILDLVISLNRSNSGYIDERVSYAISQHKQLVEAGVIEDTDNEHR